MVAKQPCTSHLKITVLFHLMSALSYIKVNYAQECKVSVKHRCEDSARAGCPANSTHATVMTTSTTSSARTAKLHCRFSSFWTRHTDLGILVFGFKGSYLHIIRKSVYAPPPLGCVSQGPYSLPPVSPPFPGPSNQNVPGLPTSQPYIKQCPPFLLHSAIIPAIPLSAMLTSKRNN